MYYREFPTREEYLLNHSSFNSSPRAARCGDDFCAQTAGFGATDSKLYLNIVGSKAFPRRIKNHYASHPIRFSAKNKGGGAKCCKFRNVLANSWQKCSKAAQRAALRAFKAGATRSIFAHGGKALRTSKTQYGLTILSCWWKTGS